MFTRWLTHDCIFNHSLSVASLVGSANPRANNSFPHISKPSESWSKLLFKTVLLKAQPLFVYPVLSLKAMQRRFRQIKLPFRGQEKKRNTALTESWLLHVTFFKLTSNCLFLASYIYFSFKWQLLWKPLEEKKVLPHLGPHWIITRSLAPGLTMKCSMGVNSGVCKNDGFTNKKSVSPFTQIS